eukprot:TRINITY_DN7707_c0_g1_i1.p1 TRINITY_DN7707_c0_g1~~TRINITY_DN7707_c0_g1_i1.p1  ORF type:complete len:149 (+),score=19.09 TRINITY_DN7707_c0_g1_i1:116-562(+)
MEERRTYTEVTKEILFKANSNVRAITKILKLPSDETVLDYAEVKDHIDDITKCIEALSKVYAVSEEEFSKTAPRVELELKNDYMFTPEENPRNSGTANADIKSLLVKVRKNVIVVCNNSKRCIKAANDTFCQVQSNHCIREGTCEIIL